MPVSIVITVAPDVGKSSGSVEDLCACRHWTLKTSVFIVVGSKSTVNESAVE